MNLAVYTHVTIVTEEKEALNWRVRETREDRTWEGMEGGKGGGSDAIRF